MSDYAKFKQTGLSRYITIGNAKLKPVEPVAPKEQPKLKRPAFRPGAKQVPQPPKRVKGSPEVILRGCFIKFNFIKHDGFVIGRFKIENSPEIYTVRGVLPVVDLQYCYQLKCTEIFKNAIEYRIDALYGTKEQPALTVLPITGKNFRKLLMEYCGMKTEDAQRTIFQIYEPIARSGDFDARKRLKITNVIIEFEYLCKNFSNESWFELLAVSWPPLRYRNFPKLMTLGWDHVALGRLNSIALSELSVDVQENPWNYLVPNRNAYNLSAIPIANIPLLNNLFGTEIGELDAKCIQFYEKVCEYIDNHKQISLNENEIIQISIDNNFPQEVRIAACAPRRKLIKIQYEKDESIQEARYYRWHEHLALQRLPGHFERLARHDVRTIPRPTKKQILRNNEIWKTLDLNKKQRQCYYNIEKHNVLLIDGGPGSGKSYVMRALRTRYRDSVVGFFVAYGVIANGLTRDLGVEFSTLAMAVDQIERNGSSAAAFLKMQVAFVDELSLIDVVLLERFLNAMTGLKVLIMAGDLCQSPCIGAGPVIYGMLKKWNGTPYIQQLTRYYRTKNPILLDNLNKLRNGRYDVQYSTRLDSDHPFIIQHRHEVPDSLRSNTKAARLGRVSILKKDLEPIYSYYLDNDPSVLDNTMLCTQRIEDVKLLNHAWWCIKFNKKIDDPYAETEFSVGETVMFCGNNLNDPDHARAAHLRSSRVMHGSTAVIVAIWDYLPYWNKEEDPDAIRGAISVESTAAKKEYYMDRVIQFSNGTQVNLRDYPLSNFQRGYAVTTSSTQGLQTDLLIYYIQPGKTRHLTRQEFYTGCSRSKNRVIVICEAKHESLHTSDIARISYNEFKLVFDIIPIYLPAFKEKIINDSEPEDNGNPFENLPPPPKISDIELLSNSSLFGGFFSGLKLVGTTIIDENACSSFQ